MVKIQLKLKNIRGIGTIFKKHKIINAMKASSKSVKALREFIQCCSESNNPVFVYLEDSDGAVAATSGANLAETKKFRLMMDIYRSEDLDEFIQKCIERAEKGEIDSIFLKAMGVTRREEKDIADLPEA